MASRTKKAALMGASPTSSLSATLSGKTSTQTKTTTTKWYEEIDYYDDEEIDEFNQRETSTAKNSRHSLETDEDESEHEVEEHEDVEATTETDGVMAKLFQPSRSQSTKPRSSPQQPHQPLGGGGSGLRPRAPTNEKLEKYKFMLINIEPDADILDPGTFALMHDSQDQSSYLGFEFNDYPAEVLYSPPFQSTQDGK